MALLDLSGASTAILIGIFVLAAAVIALAGTRLSFVADRLADATGLGEALAGTVLLGAITSLPGVVTSVTAAADGLPELAIANALGGIAAQTAFLVVGDLVYRQANLEHAAASIANLLQGTLLVMLLAVPVLAFAGPELTWFGIHPASLLLFGIYLLGVRLTRDARAAPLWAPEKTDKTVEDEPDETADDANLAGLWLQLAGFGALLGAAGFTLARAGGALSARTGLSETLVGTLFTSVATSLPELVTTVAAVRQGALTLAVSGVIGGNAFDVLFVAFADIAYRDGSIYHAMTERQVFLSALALLMTGTLLLGLLRREKHGFGNIGFESVIIVGAYLGGIALLAFG